MGGEERRREEMGGEERSNGPCFPIGAILASVNSLHCPAPVHTVHNAVCHSAQCTQLTVDSAHSSQCTVHTVDGGQCTVHSAVSQFAL